MQSKDPCYKQILSFQLNAHNIVDRLSATEYGWLTGRENFTTQ